MTSPGFAVALRSYCLIALMAVCATASALDAQASPATRIRIRTTDGVPIQGALIGVLDARRNVVAEALSNSDGARSLSLAPGRYRIQVRRIGFEPYMSDEMALPRSEELVLFILDRAVSLQKVVVTADSRCRRIEQDAAALSTVWQEIAKAMRASQLTTQDLNGIGKIYVFKKEVGLRGKVISSERNVSKLSGGRPFGAIDPRLLSSAGYVNGNSTTGWEYYAPDETVFLSDSFAATHCFRVVRDRKRPGQIGVSFEPVAGRETADVSGVLWVEEKSAELREMLFRFVNVDIISRFEAGGRTHFRRMRSGAWLVDDWSLRFPKLELQATGDRYVEIGYFENGGGIVQDSLTAR
ncbi:MAG: carboxypeptidase-like regulatory domain-containing protein [Gemmatimonadales bacterium]